MGWVILFSLSTERRTYVIALAGYLMWYWVQARKGWLDRTLFWANLVLLVLVPVDLDLPVARHALSVRHRTAGTFTALRCYAGRSITIYVTFLRPTEGPDFLGEPADRQADGKICG